jgi:hypothetical protein
MDKELREFIGSDDESDSDTGSVSSKISTRNANKRKRQDDAEDGDTDGLQRVDGSRSGSSTLKGVRTVSPITNADSVDTNNPVGNDPPNDLDDDENTEIRRGQRKIETAERQEEAEELSSDDELARELEKEFEDSSGTDEEGFMGTKHAVSGDDAEPGTVPRPTKDDEDEFIGGRDKARGREETGR